MLQNFEEWRKTRPAIPAEIRATMHYHLVSDSAYNLVFSILKGFLCNYVEKGQTRLSVRLNRDAAELLFMFLDQMETAYLHPRSFSARARYARTSSPC